MRLDQQPWFSKIRHPSRYLGGEIHSIAKDPSSVDVSIALAFPDVYEIGMSHVGLKILYHLLNSQDWLSAERAFAPWVDLESELRERNIALSSLESGRPLCEFDVVGFSLQHELCYTGVLSMLDLAHVPFFSAERGPRDPLIIAGGPACFNPEPVAGIFDAMVIGDGEEVALSLCRTVREWKRDGGRSRFELLKELSKIRGIYIPSFFEVHYDANGVIEDLEPLVEGYTGVKKATVPDLNCYPFPSRQVVPFTELVHDRFTIEIARGCSRGCRFCQAGMIYRPVRERDPLEIVRAAEAGLNETGLEDLSLLSLSSGDYTCVRPLLKELVERFAQRHIAVSFSSLRIDEVISSLTEEIKKLRRTSFTIAPEAGSQRLRDIINKGLTDDEILHSARVIYGAGWNLIKLYFMVGLPYEVDSDLRSMVELSKRIAELAPKGRKGHVLNVSVATFVPKAHTPFSWMPQLEVEESGRRIDVVRKSLRSRRVRVKWNKPEASWLEGVFSRGDRKLTEVLVEAWRQGARFDGWSEHLHVGIWREAFERKGLDPGFYLRARDPDEILPWDFIHSGVSKEFLLGEWSKALGGEKTPDSREQCPGCGVCNDPNISPVFFGRWHGSQETSTARPKEPRGATKRYRLTFTKLEKARYLSHLELMRSLVRAFRRAGMDLVYSGGYHPMPKLSMAVALPVGMESIAEVVDIEAHNIGDIAQAVERLNGELPSGISVRFMKEISAEASPPRLRESRFHIKMNGPFRIGNLDDFLRVKSYPVVRRRGDAEITVDIRSQVKEINRLSTDEVELIVRHGGAPEMKPGEIIKEVFDLSNGELERMRILKTESVLC